MLAFSLGGEEKEVVRVDVISRVAAEAEGWLQAEVYVNVGGFVA